MRATPSDQQQLSFGRSIYAKCLMITAAAAIVVAAILSALNYGVSARLALDSVVDLGTTNTTNTAKTLGGAVRFQKNEDLNLQLTQLLESSDGRANVAIVVGPDGQVLAQVLKASGNAAPLGTVAEQAMAADSLFSSEDRLTIASPVHFGQSNDVVGALAVGWTADATLSSLKKDKIQALSLTAIALILMLSVATFMLKRILGQPLQKLETAVQSVANGNYGVTIDGTGRSDEIGRLARNLDQMRENLSEAKRASDQAAADQIEQEEVIAILTNALQNLASGDLTTEIKQKVSTRYTRIRSDFNDAARKLHDALLSVVQNASQIRKESDEIGRHSGDLSRRTENQAATLEETAAALDQLTSGVRSAADSAKEVENIVKDAQSEADNSTKIVTKTVAAMSEIEGSSSQISTIISVIDDIAFQTNLLALNAGVEAARAGEAGRGFAVVASEVRALAQRSSEAAQEIKTLIGSSSEHVASGVKLVGETGNVLNTITERVTEIARLISDMANSASEQSHSLAEINIGVGQLDKATQQNAGMVESANAASQSLRHQAAELGDLVARFKTNTHSNNRRARAAA
ncbi:methyl-accepting chemotaxis protein [Loktanella agnita]|uniref:methyl-accepting chemotaxis protein n=1 Tax=Loktanella agnita TaxID=287097 RepID=UPI00398652B5